VTGVRGGGRFMVSSVPTVLTESKYHGHSETTTPTAPIPTPKVGQWKVLVVLINFLNDTRTYITPTIVDEQLSEVTQYYQEQSLQKLSLKVDTSRYFTLPVNRNCSSPVPVPFSGYTPGR
jgi:hypothetical protein